MFVHTLQMLYQKSRTIKAVLYEREIGQSLLRNIAKLTDISRHLSCCYATISEGGSCADNRTMNIKHKKIDGFQEMLFFIYRVHTVVHAPILLNEVQAS
jgi:hypothetical protein